MTSEFEIIERYFKKKMKQTALGVGDDAAMINVQKNYQLAISSDMLVENTHFLKNTNPSRLGWKSLAVNLSDIAAMGASPKWVTLSISLPKINHAWLLFRRINSGPTRRNNFYQTKRFARNCPFLRQALL